MRWLERERARLRERRTWRKLEAGLGEGLGRWLYWEKHFTREGAEEKRARIREAIGSLEAEK